jgi:hypothetical protein
MDCIWLRPSGVVLDLMFNPEKAVEPRIDTDGHGYRAFAEDPRLTQKVSQTRSPKSVLLSHRILAGCANFLPLQRFDTSTLQRLSLRLCRAESIRVHPWLMTSSSDSNCGIWVQRRRIMNSRSCLLRLGILPSAAEISGQRQLAAPTGRPMANARLVSVSRSVWSAVPRGTAFRRAHPLHTHTAFRRRAGPDLDSGGSGRCTPKGARGLRTQPGQGLGVRRLVGAFGCRDWSRSRPRPVADEQSGDESPHSKGRPQSSVQQVQKSSCTST